MLIAGVYQIGILRYRYQIIYGRMRTSYTILTYNENNTSEEFHTQVLSGRIKKDIKDSIISQVICSNLGNIQYSYGSDIIVSNFIEKINKYIGNGVLNKPTLQLYYSIGDADFKFTVYHINLNYDFVGKFNFLEYSDFLYKEDIEHSIKVGRVRSLEDLKASYDLSWILNTDGSFKKDYRTICTQEEFEWVLDNIQKATEIAFDLETTGLDFFYKGGDNADCDYIVGICLSWKENQAVYIPLESNKFECLTSDDVIPKLFPLLQRFELDGANLMFDIKVAYHYGYLFKCGFDTMQAEFDLDPTGSRGHKSLKEMTRYYIGDETLELDEVLGGPVDGKLIPNLDKDVITIYGCADADYVLRLKHIIKPHLKHMELASKLDFRMITVAAIAEYYGNRVDTKLLPILSDINKQDLKAIEHTIREYLQIAGMSKIIRDLTYRYSNELSSDEISHFIRSDEAKRLLNELLTVEVKHGVREPLNLNSSNDLDFIFNNILNYPQPKLTKKLGKKESYSRDDDYLQSLIKQVATKPSTFMQQDLMSKIVDYDFEWVSDKEKILLSKDYVNNCKYPFAILLVTYRKLEKRQSSFYDRLENLSSKGYYLTSNDMTAADTARIINVAQTIQGYIKKLIIPFPNKYTIIFDAAQIEFRVMIGLASNYWDAFIKSLGNDCPELEGKSIKSIMEKLNIPWADYHREGGCLLVGKTPSTMTKEDRSAVKGPHFAVPYGGSEYTIASDKLNGVFNEREREKIINEVGALLRTWRNKMYPLHKFLENTRDRATQPVTNPDILPPKLRESMLDTNISEEDRGVWGYVENALGRRRYYNLNYVKTAKSLIKGEPDLSNKIIANKLEKGEPLTDNETRKWNNYLNDTKRMINGLIRRSSGNYPIQSLAREYFVVMMTKLFNKLNKDGYMGMGPDKDKVILNMLVHDEGHLQVDYSIHPYKMYGYIIDNCMLNLKGYPRIYCGISVCHNWYEGKEDLYEAPVEFAFDMAKQYRENPEKFDNDNWREDPQAYVLEHTKQWIHNYVNNFIASNVVDGVFDVERFRAENDNYFVYVKVKLYTDKFTNKEEDLTSDELILLSHCENTDIIVKTPTRSFRLGDYTFNYVEKSKPKNKTTITTLNDVIDSELTTEFNELDDLDELADLDELDFDNLDSFDGSEDYSYKERDAINCYWLNSDIENYVEILPQTSSYDSVGVIEDDESVEEEEEEPYKRLLNLTGTYLLNLTGLDDITIKKVSAYCRSRKSLDGTGHSILCKKGSYSKMLNYKVTDLNVEDLKYITNEL